MSVWGQLYAGRHDALGRIMHAIEKRANAYHCATEWTHQRDDHSDGDCDAQHPSMLDGIEKEIEGILRDEGKRAINAAIGEALNSGDGSYHP